MLVNGLLRVQCSDNMCINYEELATYYSCLVETLKACEPSRWWHHTVLTHACPGAASDTVVLMLYMIQENAT